MAERAMGRGKGAAATLAGRAIAYRAQVRTAVAILVTSGLADKRLSKQPIFTVPI